MNRTPTLVLSLSVLVAGCSSSTGSSPAKTTPAPAKEAPRPKAPPSSEPTPEEIAGRERAAKVEDLYQKLSGTNTPDKGYEGAMVVVDPATGKRLQRIPKSREYYAVRGRLFNTVARVAEEGFPIVKEDEGAWYIEPVPERPVATRAAGSPNVEESRQELIIDLPADEAEVVAPPRSKKGLAFVDTSLGLPDVGMWRENFDVADLDGDGRVEIVSPPPRLSGRTLQIFKLAGDRWIQPPFSFDDPEKVGFEYGGVAVGDMDGDGKPDVLFGSHGNGPAVAYNHGNLKFLVEARKMPRQMSTRALAVGDIDGDGKLDALVLSDMPEFAQVRELEGEIGAAARRPQGSYLPGIDTRAFFSRGGVFEENHQGLEESCFGYSLGLSAKPSDGGSPFFAESCRYQGDAQLVYEYDRKESRFRNVASDVVEKYCSHLGATVGTYHGHPAAYTTYVKNGPVGSSRNISGFGVTAYYRDGGTWKRKRVYKAVTAVVTTQGVAVGDLDGDGLDDVVFADDSVHTLRVFFQRADGEFEELASEREPKFVNHSVCVRLADVDGDGRLDIVLMYQYLTGDETRAGGFLAFRNLASTPGMR
ncbi:MAG TPA: VCBS repeat-containing protein [Thermoanaerobaculia bacterium]|nr:VCBS repeat-containing protein [Thermoanaerobaculia bacterium]